MTAAGNRLGLVRPCRKVPVKRTHRTRSHWIQAAGHWIREATRKPARDGASQQEESENSVVAAEETATNKGVSR